MKKKKNDWSNHYIKDWYCYYDILIITNDTEQKSWFCLLDRGKADVCASNLWRVHSDGSDYIRVVNGKSKKLHHFLFGKPPEGLVTRHLDNNTLNNTRENVLFGTHLDNMFDRTVGVSIMRNRWQSRYFRRKKTMGLISLGTQWKTAELAQQAWILFDQYCKANPNASKDQLLIEADNIKRSLEEVNKITVLDLVTKPKLIKDLL